MKIRRTILVILALLIATGSACAAYGQEEDPTEKTVTKKITGKLCSRSPMAKPDIIGISLTGSDRKDMGRDMFFRADKEMKLENKKEFIDIDIWDTVTVIYEETTRETEDGEEEFVKRVAKSVRFVQKGKSNGTLSSVF